MINLFLSPTKSLSYKIIWVLFVIPSCVLSVDQRHIHCNSKFSCGDQKDLCYPFWTPNRAECGHPDFQVNCSGEFAVLSISSVKFRILKMDYDYRIIKLARMDYPNNLCPKNPVNSTFNQDILPFSSDTKLLTFYYNCKDPKVDVPSNGTIKQLDCKDNSSAKNYIVFSPSYADNRPILDSYRVFCNRSVNIPVSRSALGIAETNKTVTDIKKALDQGFELKFNSACSRCVTSGGSCGYNQSSRVFVCYCIDEPHEHTCSADNKSNGFSCFVTLNMSTDLS